MPQCNSIMEFSFIIIYKMFIALEVNSYQIYVDFNLAKHIFTTNANNPLNTLNFLYNSLYLLKLSTGPWSI